MGSSSSTWDQTPCPGSAKRVTGPPGESWIYSFDPHCHTAVQSDCPLHNISLNIVFFFFFLHELSKYCGDWPWGFIQLLLWFRSPLYYPGVSPPHSRVLDWNPIPALTGWGMVGSSWCHLRHSSWRQHDFCWKMESGTSWVSVELVAWNLAQERCSKHAVIVLHKRGQLQPPSPNETVCVIC